MAAPSDTSRKKLAAMTKAPMCRCKCGLILRIVAAGMLESGGGSTVEQRGRAPVFASILTAGCESSVRLRWRTPKLQVTAHGTEIWDG